MSADHVLPAHASPASRHRLVLARELIVTCPPQLGREIALTGSVARGVADSLSDIEINFWVDRLPEIGAWVPWLERAGADLAESPAEPVHDDGWLWTGVRYRGIWIELGWRELDSFEAMTDRLAQGVEHNERRLQFGWIIGNAVPLRTEGALRRWKERLSQFPEALLETMIRQNTAAWSDPHVPPVRWALAARGQRMGLAMRLQWDIGNILAVLCAVNRRWPQDWKWTDERSLDFSIKPDDLTTRIDRTLALADPLVSVRSCFELILDTLALVSPEIDVGAGRHNVESALAGEPRITRACAAVVRGESILMVEHRHATHSHWTLPGGRIDEGETPDDAAVRELAEETGLQGVAKTSLYMRPWGRGHGEGLEACFLIEVPAGSEPILGSDPELEDQGQQIAAVAWRPLAEVGEDLQVAGVIESLKRVASARDQGR